ncbi:MAG TPA: TIGR01620 family protein [Hyphomicrobiales bacterium]|jgi:putative membrane protein
MSPDEEKRRPPRFFRLGDTRLGPEETPAPAPEPEASLAAPEERSLSAEMATREMARASRGFRWGTIFLSAVGGLVSIGVSLWVANFVAGLFANGGWLGYVALGLALIAGFAALMIAAREMLGFFRLGRVAAIRLQAENALSDADRVRADDVSAKIEALFSTRQELRWGRQRLADHRSGVLNAKEVLILTERELLGPLDRNAKSIIATSVRRVSLITAVSPSAIIDVGFVALENLAMLRRLATLYGGRPGFLGSLRLARLVLGHLALTGGVAIGDDLVQQLIGHGLTARLSARLGEGVMNGAFTGRIGIAAIDLCRPLPYVEAERPRLRDFLTALRRKPAGA